MVGVSLVKKNENNAIKGFECYFEFCDNCFRYPIFIVAKVMSHSIFDVADLILFER
jgi:hypothetical protein